MPESPIPFAGAAIDRAGHLRLDEQWLDAARADGTAKAVLIGSDGASAEPVALDGAEPIAFLGVDADHAPVYLVDAPVGAELVGLRELAAVADPATAGLVAYAAAMAHFHRAYAFCGRCGRPTASREGGHTRVCPEGHTHHPRTDPVVIMLVIDHERDRILLGRQAVWPGRRYSALAGFVEPGETLESAVAREVAEESGITVANVRYIASQPWPFPASLMLGFHADWAVGDPTPLDSELEDVRWFERAEVLDAARHDISFLGTEAAPGDGLVLPPRVAIARRLIATWL